MKNIKTIKKIGMGIGGIIALIVLVYSLSWFWMAGQIKEEINVFLMQEKQKNIHVMTRSFGITGFPRRYDVHFSGRVTANGIVLEIPDLHIRSNFLPGTPLILDASQGLFILEPAITDLWSLDFLHMETEIPLSFPADLTREDLTKWRQEGNTLILKNIELRKNTLALKGNARLELDHMLQPAGVFQARITGHMEFLRRLQTKGYIKIREALLAKAVLSGLSRKDTDKTYIEVALALQNQSLFIGPLRIFYIPTIHWKWRHTDIR